MADIEEIFASAERAVAGEVLELRSDLEDNWRDIAPSALGLDVDNWLVLSFRIVRRFNRSSGVTRINLSEPARASYHEQRLINFVGALADGAGQVS